jgi:hypothetical protein
MQTSALRSTRLDEPHDLHCEDVLAMTSPKQRNRWMVLLLIEDDLQLSKLLVCAASRLGRGQTGFELLSDLRVMCVYFR